MLINTIAVIGCNRIIGLASLLLAASATPASAQLTVFDPHNYSQNLLTAARTLQQVNNQIQSLQNQATMLLNQAKNLTRVDFPELQALRQTMQQIDTLMAQARGITFRVSGLDQQFRQLFPRGFGQAVHGDSQLAAARTRFDTTMDAYQHTMTVQAQVVENIGSDAATLDGIVAKSQSAEGALQAQQASTQMLALVAKEQLQLQNLMAAQYRAQAIDAARGAEAQADAQTATRRFLGSGVAYPPR